MTMKKICVIGGAGFVGSSIVTKLDDEGYQVTVLTRHRERAKHLILLPHVQVATCDIHDDAALKSAIHGHDAVINLVGILHETKVNSFDTAHHLLPKRIADFCHALGIDRLIHISALRASQDAPSAYLQSKAKGEAALESHAGDTDITIYQPSVIFGRGDGFINLFAQLVKWLPIIFLAKPNAKFQPIWVEDVADIIVNNLFNTDTYDRVYELAGPKVYTMRTLLQMVTDMLGKNRWVFGLSDRLSYLQAWCMEWLPIKLMTRDNIKSMEVDSVGSAPMAEEIKYPLATLEAIMPSYVINKNQRGAYNRFRAAAGRVINARR